MTTTSKGSQPHISRGLGLQLRFAVSILIVIAGMIFLVGYILHSHMRSALAAQLRITGLALAKIVATNAVEALKKNDQLLLADLVDKSMQQGEGVRHLALVDPKGKIIAHSDFKQEGLKYRYPENTVTEILGGSRVISYAQNNEQYLECVAPILNKDNGGTRQLGTAHLLYSLAPLDKKITAMLSPLPYIAGAGLLLVVILVFYFLGQVTNLLNRLAEGAEQLSQGSLNIQLPVKRYNELEHAAARFNQMVLDIKRSQERMLEKEKRRREMEIAQIIQNTLVDKTAPRIKGYSLGKLYRSAQEAAGDYCDFVQLSKGLWGMTVADVSGKGILGGLVISQVRTLLRSTGFVSLSPRETLLEVERQLSRDMHEDMYVTISYMALDQAKQVVTLARAGHTPAVVYRQDAKQCEWITPPGLAIGIASSPAFERVLGDKRIKLGKGDFILLYTNGVEAAYNDKMEYFGTERLSACLKAAANVSALKIIERLEKEIQLFTAGFPQLDDMAMIVVKAEEESKA
ncbi:SpoIIE family protein phosphatase [candidate division FCPU426 bacterium]|nr:SpoIIE family protein phosphatase [candidate division FCPU426 bacterium]